MIIQIKTNFWNGHDGDKGMFKTCCNKKMNSYFNTKIKEQPQMGL
jgi:hypothetical protein